MTNLKITLPVSGAVPALLTLPQPLTAQALLELEHAVIGTLAMLGRDLLDTGAVTSPEHSEHATQGREAAEIEYASWMPDPGAIEVASWATHIRTSAR